MRTGESVEVTPERIILRRGSRPVWDIRWPEIARVEAYKVDLVTTDDVCLDLHLAERSYVLDEETPGWAELAAAVAERMNVRPEWFADIVQPPFATNRMILWDRSVSDALGHLAVDELWELARSDFAQGALREISIRETTLSGWNDVVALARGLFGTVDVSVRGTDSVIHELTERSFIRRHRASVTIHAGGVDVIGHCFSPDVMELRFRPEQVRGTSELSALLRFLTAAAVLLQQTVTVTPENLPDHPILTIAASGETRYRPADGACG